MHAENENENRDLIAIDQVNSVLVTREGDKKLELAISSIEEAFGESHFTIDVMNKAFKKLKKDRKFNADKLESRIRNLPIGSISEEITTEQMVMLLTCPLECIPTVMRMIDGDDVEDDDPYED